MSKDNWITEEAIALVDNERKTHEDSLIYITERVAFRMRDLVRTCYKNYWGIFDDPIDSLTGREKIWYPLSEEVANGWVDNSDLDQKDIGFRTKPGGEYCVTEFTRQIVKNHLDETGFGQELDDSAFQKGITGTAIWKIYKNGEKLPQRTLVNRLNFYIDTSAKSIQDAYRVTERSLMFPDEIKRMTVEILDNLKTEKGLPNFDPEVLKGGTQNETKARDVWETTGKIPERLITGNKEDAMELDGRIVVSGLEAGNPVCHLIERNTKKDPHTGLALKPYEEDWAERVPGRWDGRGPVEKVMMLQLWINTIVNIRVNRHLVSQLGLFKIRRGANITPQSIQKLGANGAILVSSMDDIEHLVMQEASQSSYADENNIRDIAKRITRTVEAVTGERMAASMPATNASLQASSAKNAFTKIKERSGFFVERLLNRHVIPAVVEATPRESIVRILHNDHNIDEILNRIAYYYLDKYQDDLEAEDLFLTPDQLEIALQQIKENLKGRPEIFIKNFKELVASQVDATVYISNEELDMGTTVDKLVMGANLLPEMDRQPVVRQIFDTLGIPYPPELSYKNRQPETQIPSPQGIMPPQDVQQRNLMV